MADLIRDEVAVALETAKAKLDAQLPALVAGISLRLMERVRVECFERELVLRVDLNMPKTGDTQEGPR
jgi:hypothetical protein